MSEAAVVQGACGLEANSVQTVLTMDQVVKQQEAGAGDNRTSFKAPLNTLFKDFQVFKIMLNVKS